MLEKKIRDQAKRLLDLQNYINLCEKRIKQINPTNLLPITEEQIGHLSNKELKSSDSDNHNLIIQVRNLKSLLKLKDQEIMNHIRKYDTSSQADKLTRAQIASRIIELCLIEVEARRVYLWDWLQNHTLNNKKDSKSL